MLLLRKSSGDLRHHQPPRLSLAQDIESRTCLVLVVEELRLRYLVVGHALEVKRIGWTKVRRAWVRERMGTLWLRTIGWRLLLHRYRQGGKVSWWEILDWADDSILSKVLGRNKPQDRQADVLHVLGKVHSQFLPRGEGLATEPAGLVLGPIRSLDVAPFDLLPGKVTAASLFDGGLGLDLGLGEFVFADEMLQEVVASVAGVPAVFDITRPPFKMAVAFVLMTNPVSFSLEHLRVAAPVPRAREGLDVLVHMLGPIRRLDKLAGTEAQLAFEFLQNSQ
jgi:hypothetical protein